MIQFPAFDELSRIYRILYDTHYECGMRVTASMMLITSQQITNPVYVYLAFIQFHTNLAPLDATSSLSWQNGNQNHHLPATVRIEEHLRESRPVIIDSKFVRFGWFDLHNNLQ